jgi:FkbM family methyltransferase
MLAGAAVSLLSVLYSDFGDRQGVERGLHDSANAGCRDCGCAPLGGDGRTYCNMDNGKETATRCCRHCTFKPGSAYGGACESLAVHGATAETGFVVAPVLDAQLPYLYAWHKTISLALPEELPQLIKTLPHDAIVVDLGGNVGAFSETLTRSCSACTVHIVEAVPRYAQFIKHNNPHFNVYNVGLATEPGSFDLWMSPSNLGWNTAIASEKEGDQYKIVVPTARFDDVVHVGSIDVLKIDVEGAEWMVISGMHETLKKLPCLPHLVMEVGWGTSHPQWPKLKEQLDFLHELGYPELNVESKTMDIWFKSTCPPRAR